MKQKYCFLAFSNPTAGKEAEYNEWYDTTHLADVLAIPGFVSARRFRIAEEPGVSNGDLPARYLALYEVETDAPGEMFAEMHRRAGTAAMPLSDAIDVINSSQALLVEIAGPVLSCGARPPSEGASPGDGTNRE